jgi:hypothetical protein
MAPRSFFLLLAVAGVCVTPAFGYDGRTVSGPAHQSAAEVEDIGVVAEAAPGEAATTDGKAALPPQAPSHFRLNVGLNPRFTSNAQLSGNHKSDDFLFLPSIEAGYKLPMDHGFEFDTVGHIDSGIYGRYTDRTFIGYSLENTFSWRPTPKAPRVFLGVEPYRLDRFDGQGRITEAFALSAGSDWGYAFNNGNSLLFIGYALTDNFSDPKIDSRVSNSVIVGYSQLLAPKLIGQVFYQYVHDNYQSFNRDDDRHTVGLSLTYQIDRHFFTTLAASFADNDSTQNHASYQSAGVGISLNYQY